MDNGVKFILYVIGYLVIGALISLIYYLKESKNGTWSEDDDPGVCGCFTFAWPIFVLMLICIYAIEWIMTLKLRWRKRKLKRLERLMEKEKEE